MLYKIILKKYLLRSRKFMVFFLILDLRGFPTCGITNNRIFTRM